MTSARFDILGQSPDLPAPALPERGATAEEAMPEWLDGPTFSHGILRAQGDPHACFTEEPLRILQAVRLVSQQGLGLDADTLQAMRAHKLRLARVETQRIVSELDGILLGEHARDALMAGIDVMVVPLPELAACKGFEQHTPYHIYDVWEHTAWVVQRSPRTRLSRWAALLHDIGKPAAFFMEGDVGHFYGHPKLSVVLARSIVERMEFAPGFAREVLLLVELHDALVKPEADAMQRALERLGGNVELLRALAKLKQADALSQSDRAQPRLQLAYDLERAINAL